MWSQVSELCNQTDVTLNCACLHVNWWTLGLSELQFSIDNNNRFLRMVTSKYNVAVAGTPEPPGQLQIPALPFY